MRNRAPFYFATIAYLCMIPQYALAQDEPFPDQISNDVLSDRSEPNSQTCDDIGTDKNVTEFSGVFSQAEFPNVDQSIAQLGVSHSRCSDFDFVDRFVFEGIVAAVEEDNRRNGQFSVAVGGIKNFDLLKPVKKSNVPMEQAEAPDRLNFSVAALARVGYAEFESIGSQTLSGVEMRMGFVSDLSPRRAKFVNEPVVTVERGIEITRARAVAVGVPKVQFIGNFSVDYSQFQWQTGSGLNNAALIDENVLSTYGELGLDFGIFKDDFQLFKIKRDWRTRVALSHRDNDADFSVKNITGISASLRPVDELHTRYPWSLNLTFQDADDYSAVLIGMSIRPGGKH